MRSIFILCRKHGESHSRILVSPETPSGETRKIKDALAAKHGVDGEICEAAIYEAVPIRTFKFRKPAAPLSAAAEVAPTAAPVAPVAESPKARHKRGDKPNPDWD